MAAAGLEQMKAVPTPRGRCLLSTGNEVTGPDPANLKRNFWAWVAYQFFYRTGWQFKMEATLVAGLISYLTPSQRILGLFTTINTLGRQASPFFAAPHVDRWAYKRSALLLYWSATVACWLALTVYLWSPA